MSAPLVMLGRALRPDERRRIERRFRRALESGASCALEGTAFVSLYERGRVIGCVGHADARSALAAARSDPRFGGARHDAGERTVQLSLLVRGRAQTPAAAQEQLEVGREGLIALDESGAVRAVLLPEVAADGQRDAASMMVSLAAKAGLASVESLHRVMRVTSERFVVRPERRPVARARTPVDLAAAWLAARVEADGSVVHGIDARSRRVHRTGPFHLGRAAVVIEALDAHGAHPRPVARARRWLAAAIDAALSNEGQGLPAGPAERAGSLALAIRAGVDVRAALHALLDVHPREIAEHGWHAAQIVSAIGTAAPAWLQASALAPIDHDTWAPWSVLAADALGDRARAKRGRARVAVGVARKPPHVGAVRGHSGVAELALTALALEVLAPSRAHAAPARRAAALLVEWTFTAIDRIPAALDPALALGAAPLAPHADFLRADVTAHVVLGLLAAARRRLPTSRAAS